MREGGGTVGGGVLEKSKGRRGLMGRLSETRSGLTLCVQPSQRSKRTTLQRKL